MKKTILLWAFALGAGIGLSSIAFGDNTACENRCWGAGLQACAFVCKEHGSRCAHRETQNDFDNPTYAPARGPHCGAPTPMPEPSRS